MFDFHLTPLLSRSGLNNDATMTAPVAHSYSVVPNTENLEFLRHGWSVVVTELDLEMASSPMAVVSIGIERNGLLVVRTETPAILSATARTLSVRVEEYEGKVRRVIVSDPCGAFWTFKPALA